VLTIILIANTGTDASIGRTSRGYIRCGSSEDSVSSLLLNPPVVRQSSIDYATSFKNKGDLSPFGFDLDVSEHRRVFTKSTVHSGNGDADLNGRKVDDEMTDGSVKDVSIAEDNDVELNEQEVDDDSYIPSHILGLTGSAAPLILDPSRSPWQASGYVLEGPPRLNPPCDTLRIENIPFDTSSDELKALFARQSGFRRMVQRPSKIWWVQFENVSFATKALHELEGRQLHNSTQGGIRLSYSESSLVLRYSQISSDDSTSARSSDMNIKGQSLLENKKQESLEEEIATRTTHEDRVTHDDMSKTDENNDTEECAIDDDNSPDEKDSIEESRMPNIDQYLIATLRHQNDRAAALANVTSQAAAAMTSPQGHSAPPPQWQENADSMREWLHANAEGNLRKRDNFSFAVEKPSQFSLDNEKSSDNSNNDFPGPWNIKMDTTGNMSAENASKQRLSKEIGFQTLDAGHNVRGLRDTEITEQRLPPLINGRRYLHELDDPMPIPEDVRAPALEALHKYYRAVSLRERALLEASATAGPARSEHLTGTSITNMKFAFSAKNRFMQLEPAARRPPNVSQARRAFLQKLPFCQQDCNPRKVKVTNTLVRPLVQN
jgi:hypothetical protein